MQCIRKLVADETFEIGFSLVLVLDASFKFRTYFSKNAITYFLKNFKNPKTCFTLWTLFITYDIVLRKIHVLISATRTSFAMHRKNVQVELETWIRPNFVGEKKP